MENDLFLAEVDGEALLIDVEKGMSYFLNETGLITYKMLKEGKSAKEIRNFLLDEYDVTEQEVEKDIRDFRNLLDQKGISCAKKDT